MGKPEHYQQYIAEDDILCYKMLQSIADVLSAPYSIYIYKLNEKQEEIQMKPISDIGFPEEVVIHEGYHSYSELCFAKEAISSFPHPKFRLFTAIIPKGSTYFKNDREYVSSNIIIKEEIEL